MKIEDFENFDAVVIGAGPAGLSCVKELLRKNKKILLIYPGSDLSENIGGLANQWHSQCAVFQEKDLQNSQIFNNWPLNYEEYFRYIKEIEQIFEIDIKENNSSVEIMQFENGLRSINQVKTLIGSRLKWTELFKYELSHQNLTKINGEVVTILHEGIARGILLKDGRSILFAPRIKIYLAAGCAKNTQILGQSNFNKLTDSKVFGNYLTDHPMFENHILEKGHKKNFYEIFKNKKSSGKKFKEKTKYEIVVNSKILGVFEIRHYYTKRALDENHKTISPDEILKQIVNRIMQKIFKRIVFKPLQSKLWIQLAQNLNPDSKFFVDQKAFHEAWQMDQIDLQNYHEIVNTAELLLKKWGFKLKEIKNINSVQDLRESSIPAYHPSGTTRAHASKEFGVVDGIGKLYDCENLFLCGSSIFTTPGWANPTLTIMALSMRTARLSN